MKTLKFLPGVMILLLTVTLDSCKKEAAQTGLDTESITNETVNSFVEKSITSDEDASTMRGNGSCNWLELLPECAVVTESGDTYPKTITIDYGNGCTNANEITKSGIITIQLSDDMMNEGAIRTVTFQNYYVNNTHIEGTRITTNTGTNDAGQPVFSRNVNTNITRNGNTFNRTSDEEVTWLSGFDTVECGDNVFSVTGSGTCTRAEGTTRTRNIVTPLIIDQVCGYITTGVVQITGPQGTGSIDFGDGTCDDLAIVTRPNGDTQEIHLHQN